MRFIYTYRSSDGQRHAAKIEAPSRDAAFVAIRRELGVKPIKVTAEEEARWGAGTKSPSVVGKVLLLTAACLALIAAGFGAWWWMTRQSGAKPSMYALARWHSRYNAATFPAYTNLVARAWAQEKATRARLDALDLDVLSNYALVEQMSDDRFFLDKISSGYKVIDSSRSEIRELFRSLYDIFPPECVNERLDAQRLYVETMDSVDLQEEKLAAADKAFRMLRANRGKWHVRKGKVLWSDKALEKEFGFLSLEVNPSTARWEKDFASPRAPSPPIPLP